MRYIKTYEVGDVVWVKEGLKVNEMYGIAYFDYPMLEVDVVTIKSIKFDGEVPTYRVEEVGGVCYTNEMLGNILSKEQIEARKCPFKVGDVVRVTNTSDTQISHLFNNRGVVRAIDWEDSILVDFGYCYDCLHRGGGDYGIPQNSAYWFSSTNIEVVNRQSLNECDL